MGEGEGSILAADVQQAGTKQEGFVRGLKLIDATTLVIGTMIGSGIFIVSADIARTVHSTALLLIVWSIAGILTVIGALSYAELTAQQMVAMAVTISLILLIYRPAYTWPGLIIVLTGVPAYYIWRRIEGPRHD